MRLGRDPGGGRRRSGKVPREETGRGRGHGAVANGCGRLKHEEKEAPPISEEKGVFRIVEDLEEECSPVLAQKAQVAGYFVPIPVTQEPRPGDFVARGPRGEAETPAGASAPPPAAVKTVSGAPPSQQTASRAPPRDAAV